MKTNYSKDRARLLESQEACDARMAQLKSPHIVALTVFVDLLRDKKGRNYRIPYFDPADGGIAAEILFLFEAPGKRAVQTGFISRNNPDESAKNFFNLNIEAGIRRKRTISWNIVPWYIGSGKHIRAATSRDIEAGARPLASLLELLPRLRAIVLFGRKAQRGAPLIAKLSPSVRLFASPHPSPQYVNRAPHNRKKILSVLREALEYLDNTSR